MGTGYYDLVGDNFQPPAGWQKTPEGKTTLADSYACKLRRLAVDFDTPEPRVVPLRKLRSNAGEIVIQSYRNGFLRSIPNLGKYVAWHTASNEADPVNRRVRCPGNLFLNIIGGGTIRARLEPDGSSTVVDPAPIDGILPGIDSAAFKRGDAAEACRFLAATILREVAKTELEADDDLADGPCGVGQWRCNGEVLSSTMQVGAWKMVNHLWGQPDHTATFDELIVPVYSDAEYVADENAFGSLRREANKFFGDNCIPWRASLCKGTVLLKSKE